MIFLNISHCIKKKSDFFSILKELEMRYGMNYFKNNCMVPVETAESLALDECAVNFPRCLTGRNELLHAVTDTGNLIL